MDLRKRLSAIPWPIAVAVGLCLGLFFGAILTLSHAGHGPFSGHPSPTARMSLSRPQREIGAPSDDVRLPKVPLSRASPVLTIEGRLEKRVITP